MSLLSKLEPRLRRFALPNLTVLLIAGQVFLYLVDQLKLGPGNEDLLQSIRLYPAKVLEGEIWRLLTFVFDPPTTILIFAFFFWYLFFLMGTTLEANWGDFRYNVFLGIGYIASVAMAFVMYWIDPEAQLPANNGFLYGTVFLAFARLFPDFVITLFFILPVKIKWLAMLQWIGYGLNLLFGPWIIKGMVVASVANYLLFFGSDVWRSMRKSHRRMRYQAGTLKAPGRLVHRCTICGLTSDESPQTQFRYCSKCEGTLCYCPEHLQNHEHVIGRETPEAAR